MKRYKSKIILMVLSLFIIGITLINPVLVNADNTGGGTGSQWGDCNDCQWLFNRVGIRLSLYRYDGTNLNYYGSVDHCSSYGSFMCASGNAYQDSKKAGKVAHQQFSDYQGGSWNNASIVTDNTNKFPDVREWNSVENFTKEYFSLTTKNKSSILQKLKSEFSSASGLTTADLGNIYITIEPTMNIYNTTNGTMYNYYGTAYEFANYFGGTAVPGLNEVIYYGLPEYMMAQTMSGTDPNSFIGRYVELVPTTQLTRSVYTDANRTSNKNLITSTKGYGINVFWLGNYITNCSITQSSNKLDYILNLSGNTTDISYGISNDANKITNSTIYRANSSDTMIYGVVKGSDGATLTTCSLPRTPYSCTVTRSSSSDTYYLNTNGDLNGTLYGISNVNGTTNGLKTYNALNEDTMIYGTIKNNEGIVLASCSIERTPYTCSITTNDKKQYNLNLTGDLSIVNYGISNISSTTNDKKIYSADYFDTMIYGTIKDKSGNIITTCSLQRDKDTCSSVCANRDGNDLLSCAESFCQLGSTNSLDKKTCIKTCGIEEAKFSSCVTDSMKEGSNTECEAETSSSKTTCTVATVDTYYKTTCQETSTIKFPGNLPTVLKPGMGFSYNPVLTGNKTCKLEFETDKWLFDYMSSYSIAEREKLLDIIKEYNSKNIINDNSNYYKYFSSDADINMNVMVGEDDFTSIKLFATDTTNLLDEEIVIVNGDTIEIILFANGKEELYEFYDLIQTTSSNQTIYKLKGVCISSVDGSSYDIEEDSCKENDEIVYEYITSNDIKASEYDTNVTVDKISSNLSVGNTCYYGIEKIENPPTGDNTIIMIVGIVSIMGVAVISYNKLRKSTN